MVNIAILQARFNSSRLPGKGLFSFFNQTIWERMCDIACDIKICDKVIFAYGGTCYHKELKEHLREKNIEIFTGDENDVYKRFVDVAKKYKPTNIIRITCDNYLVQPDFIEKLYEEYIQTNSEYAYIEPLSHYCGEIIKTDLLFKHWEDGKLSNEAKEHVTYDFRDNASIKKCSLPSNFLDVDHNHSITLDNTDDLVLMKSLEKKYQELKNIRCVEALKTIVK